MAEGNVNDEVMMCSEEGLEALLPSHVLDEATIMSPKAKKTLERRSHNSYLRHGSRRPLDGNGLVRQAKPTTTTTTTQRMHRQKNEKFNGNFAWGHGHGMRAAFMDSCSSRRPCAGTGVFLPKIVTTNIQPDSTKPGMNWESNNGGNRFGKSGHGEGSKETKQGCNLRQSSSSPDTFLPKDWTY